MRVFTLHIVLDTLTSTFHVAHSPSHIPHLLQTLHFSLPTPPPSGNTFIDEITEHITQFVQHNLMTELALDPSDESLLVSREKVNGHIYHMFKDGQVTLPEPVSVHSVGGEGGGVHDH